MIGDSARFTQIINNLVDNAIKFTDKGSIRIQCQSKVASPGGPVTLSVEVIDTGIGMSEEKLG